MKADLRSSPVPSLALLPVKIFCLVIYYPVLIRTSFPDLKSLPATFGSEVGSAEKSICEPATDKLTAKVALAPLPVSIVVVPDWIKRSPPDEVNKPN